MPHLFGVEVSDEVYAANKHLAAPPKEDKTQARKRLEAEQRRNFAMQFEAVWRTLGGPALTPEFRFCEWRKWHADYYCETATGKWLIELEGGVWTGGRHTRGKGFVEDCVKYNTATLLGYRVFRIPTGFATAQYLQQIVDSLAHVTDANDLHACHHKKGNCKMTETLWSDNQIYDLLTPVFEMRKEYEAALAAKDSQIAILEAALATLAAERKAEVAELEAIKAALAAKATAQTERCTPNADMLQDAGDGAYN